MSESLGQAQQDGAQTSSTGPLPQMRRLPHVSASSLRPHRMPSSPAPHPLPFDLDAREGGGVEMGADTRLSWAARTDIGLVRGHNEDSYLARNPLFGVCDGMGGHAAGEVASSIAVRTIASTAPTTADDALLGAAIEAANEAVIMGAANGEGKAGMGCTASCCVIEGTKMAVAHVGDSRIYLLHAGTLVRITHDHSYVEELVDAGEITADEARVHPSRSIITRALGSDPDMYADHFQLDVERGDRVIVCSDGLSSMVPDSTIEALAVSSATPIDCTDHLVAEALGAGGHDNVSVITIDVVSDGREEARRLARKRAILGWLAGIAAVTVASALVLSIVIRTSWYVGVNDGKVGIYQGINSSFMGMRLSSLVQSTDVNLQDLPEATRHQLAAGISVASEEEAANTVNAYAEQIEKDHESAEKTASDASSDSTDGSVGSAAGASGPEAADTGAATTEGGE